MRLVFATVALIGLLALTGCDSDDPANPPGNGKAKSSAKGVDPTPENQHGIPSGEFEQDDIDAANNASEEVQDYCGGIESEAQRVGCLSHVDESDIP